MDKKEMIKFLSQSDQITEKIKVTLKRLRPKQLLDMVRKIRDIPAKVNSLDESEKGKVQK